MKGELNRNMIVAVIAIAVLLVGGLGFMWMNQSRPAPPANYQPVMPPSGYGGQASGMAGRSHPSGPGGATGANGPSSGSGGMRFGNGP